MTRSIDLNADMGEYGDEAQRDVETALMPLVSSCSIACGGHAGDADTMRATAHLAKIHGISIGAHPSFPDRKGFGRRSLAFDPQDLLQALTGQISDLKSILATDSLYLNHVKPHGALYNDAAKDDRLSRVLVEATRQTCPDAIIVGPAGSEIDKAARIAGLAFAAEGFVDRLYRADGSLTPRGKPGAIIEDVAARAAQAAAIARGAPFGAADGTITIKAKTLCIHSDSPGAVETARAVRTALEADGFQIKAFR